MPAAGKGRVAADGAWKINLCRDWKSPWQWSSLAAAKGGYGFTGVRFVFAADAPAVQYRAEPDPFLANFRGLLTLHNPSAAPMTLKAAMTLDRNRMPAIRAAETGLIAPDGVDLTADRARYGYE